jgi:hypothetical protein
MRLPTLLETRGLGDASLTSWTAAGTPYEIVAVAAGAHRRGPLWGREERARPMSGIGVPRARHSDWSTNRGR